MSDFYDAVDAALDATAKSDRQLICRPTIFADFKSGPVHIWGGMGALITPDGTRWQGWQYVDDDGTVYSYIQRPKLTDIRDGNSALYEFTLGYISAEQYKAVRDTEEEVKDRLLIVSAVYLPDGKLRALTPPGDSWRLRMQNSRFTERRVREKDGGQRVLYSCSVTAQNINEGRSRTQFGLMNDAGQKARSMQLFGVANDTYAQFVIKYINGYHVNVSES